ncbi:MAG: hypothetical protein KIT45_06460 [Fimbriimonadia bacterium]|nr:hypothetical protein [Fimbriimonadia bacterium]
MTKGDHHDPALFWKRGNNAMAGMGLLGVAVLWMMGHTTMGIGYGVGAGTIYLIIALYRRIARSYARPHVAPGVFQRILLLGGIVKYPLLLFIVFGVTRLGEPAALGFVIGVSFCLIALGTTAVLGEKAAKKAG